MKRVITVNVLVAIILLFCTGSAMGQSIPGSIEGGFYLGEASSRVADLSASEDVDGFYYVAELLTEPLGGVVSMDLVSGVTFEGVKFDILGSYLIPGVEDVSPRVLFGYSYTNLLYDYERLKFKGFLVGGKGEVSPFANLILTGYLGIGLGMDCVVEMSGYIPVTLSANLLQYKFGVNYAVTDQLQIVGTFRGKNIL